MAALERKWKRSARKFEQAAQRRCERLPVRKPAVWTARPTRFLRLLPTSRPSSGNWRRWSNSWRAATARPSHCNQRPSAMGTQSLSRPLAPGGSGSNTRRRARESLEAQRVDQVARCASTRAQADSALAERGEGLPTDVDPATAVAEAERRLRAAQEELDALRQVSQQLRARSVLAFDRAIGDRRVGGDEEVARGRDSTGRSSPRTAGSRRRPRACRCPARVGVSRG